MDMKYLKAIWIFCSYLFVPQWGRYPRMLSFGVKVKNYNDYHNRK